MKFLKPFLSFFYCKFSSLNRWFYQVGLRKSHYIKKPVLSVGNLSMGGSGKTPLVVNLCEQLIQYQLKVAVISKSYHASLKGPKEVPDFADPQIYGDEAVLLKSLLPQVKVFSGPVKWKTAALAELDSEVNILLIDDGFQHLALKQDWKALVFDTSKDQSEFWQREALAAAKNAQVLFLSRTQAGPKRRLLKKLKDLNIDRPLFEIVVKNFRLTKTSESSEKIESGTYGVVAGIGNPDQFLANLVEYSPQAKYELLRGKDHQIYTRELIFEIEKKRQEKKWNGIICTRKDWIKISRYSTSSYWWVSDFDSHIEPDLEWKKYWTSLLGDLKK